MNNMNRLVKQINKIGSQYGFRFIPNKLYCEYIYKDSNGSEYKGKCALNPDVLKNKAVYFISVINQDVGSVHLAQIRKL
jgi:hypothetical protein